VEYLYQWRIQKIVLGDGIRGFEGMQGIAPAEIWGEDPRNRLLMHSVQW